MLALLSGGEETSVSSKASGCCQLGHLLNGSFDFVGKFPWDIYISTGKKNRVRKEK